MRSPLRVGLNLVFLNDAAGGMGRYARELLPALLRTDGDLRLTAFVSRDLPNELLEAPWASEVEWVRFPVAAVGSPVHLLAELFAIPLSARRRGLHVIHGLANIAPPVAPGVATVVTVHDLIWWHHRDAMPLHSRAVQRSLTPISARRARLVITPSEAARADVIRTLALPPLRVRVVAHGAGGGRAPEPTAATILRARHGLNRVRVVLCVSQLRPYKNVAALVEAMSLLKRADVALVVCGAPSDHSNELRQLARALGVDHQLRLIGWVSEADLEGLYQLAECVVLPSLAEGFGLPVLEAMMRGVPVACSDTTALPEVAGDAAMPFDPHNPGAIASVVMRLLDDQALTADLARRGRQRAALFTWDRAAADTVSIYREAIAARS
jgi:glycosyltransferase involved in cell wall biosynthesis